MPTMIGLIMLMGIVTKNSILLVDYAILARKAGMNRFDALVDACHKRSRPIIMTTIAMGAGMMPLALGFSGDPSFRSPMAIAVIGGLITSTLLSLLVVPAVFTYVDDFKHRRHIVPAFLLCQLPQPFVARLRLTIPAPSIAMPNSASDPGSGTSASLN
jgi:Cu/Ag efflux pump CusA